MLNNDILRSLRYTLAIGDGEVAAIAELAGLPLKGVGEDTISLDPCDSVDFPNHMTLLGADFVNTENLKGLDKLLGRRFTFVTLPLKFENADGCSCRAIALEE